MRPIHLVAVVAASLAILASAAHAQQPPLQRGDEVFQRTYFFEKEVRDRLEAAVPSKQPALIEWGGMYIPSYTYFNDTNNENASLTVQDLRLWTQITLDDVHRIFARGRLAYTDWSDGDSGVYPEHDLEGMNLEIGYYELDVARAAEKYWGAKWPFQMKARGGRQYIEFGRGLVLDQALDAGLFTIDTGQIGFTGFAGRNIESQDNIDRSVPGFSRSRRTFYGAEVRYKGIPRHEPYAYWVLQRDWSEEKPENPAQDYRYDSHYYAIGSRGQLAPRTKYELESVWEFGRGAANGQINDHRERVRGFAFDAEVDHYLKHPLDPTLSLEYAYASGDGDRQNATNAFMGNRAGTVDNSFLGFGYVNSGLALGARFTNIQFVRLGGRLTPYNKKAALGRVDVGLNYYFLFKSDAGGPISDPTAVEDSSDLGQEVDVFCEWRILSDLSLSVYYGRLYPGQAYLDRQPRDFLFTALTISF